MAHGERMTIVQVVVGPREARLSIECRERDVKSAGLNGQIVPLMYFIDGVPVTREDYLAVIETLTRVG